MVLVADAAVAIRGDLSKFSGDLKQAEAQTQTLGGKLKNALSPANIAGGLAGGFAASQVFSFFGDAIDAASDLAETTSKVGVVFEDQADSIMEMGETSAEALGMSKDAALAAAGTYGNLFRAMGISTEASAQMSTGLVQLAADLASFNNMDPTEVLDKLRAGLSGETEPLKTLGVNLSAARIEAEAMAMGFEKVNGALTPAAKAQATYALILKDTTLAQGDFARTSDGLANTQRINAAKLEDAMARLGEVLLPLATGFAGLAGDVLPELIDAIQDVFKVVGPLGELWFKHANVLIPALVAVISLKLISALKGLVIQAKLTGLSMKAMWSAALLGLPFLIEGVAAVQGGLDDFTSGLGKSEAEIQEWHKLIELVGGNRVMAHALTEMGVSAEDFARIMEQTEGDVSAAFDLIALASGDVAEVLRHDASSISGEWSEAAKQAYAAAYGTGTAAGNALSAGKDAVADGAHTAFSPIHDEIVAAREKAKAEAFKIPAEIAQAIIDGRDEVVVAGTLLANAATDPLMNEQRIAAAREKIKELAHMTAEEIEAATPASALARQIELEKLDVMLAAYLLRADPKSKEAAGLLAKYFKSEDPATQLALETMMGAVEYRAYVMANEIEAEAARAGIAPEEAFRRHKVAAATEAALLGAGVRIRLRAELNFDSTADGVDIGGKWAAGVAAGILKNYYMVENAGAAVRNLLDQAGTPSPAKPSAPAKPPAPAPAPVTPKAPIYKQPLPQFAEGVWDVPYNMLAGLHRGEMVVPRAIANATRQVFGGGVMGGSVTNINLTVEGEKPVVSTAVEIAEQAARLGRFKG